MAVGRKEFQPVSQCIKLETKRQIAFESAFLSNESGQNWLSILNPVYLQDYPYSPVNKQAMITPFLEVDFEKVRQKTVKKFIANFGLHKCTGFTELKPECYDPSREKSYHVHRKTFLIKNNVESVWNAYTTIHPKEAWNGAMVSFGLQYSRLKNRINYLNDDYSGMEKGQIIILNLRFLWGGFNIAVAHEVCEVNEQDRTIKLCYMRGGASTGSQIITLRQTGEGFTEVSHKTFYKSNSHFRDTRLYPTLHTKAITEFHLNVKKKAEALSRLSTN